MIDLKHTKGRVIVYVDLESKNWHTFSSGHKIRLERNYNNLNKRETQPVNGIVIDSEYIPKGSEVLLGHNCTHDVYKIFNVGKLSGEEQASDIKYFSIPEEQVFLWREEGKDWKPTKNFATALRVFKPYEGVLQGIEPTVLKDILYITSGELSGNVVLTLKSCDYQIVFQDRNGQEGNIIRCRHYEDEYNDREEIIAISHELTEKVKNGEYLIGITKSDCKRENDIEAYAD
jgi:hypothetical protein